jgi:dolichyl-diphosphooligosaccharide--protein glycosyltransferase
MKFPRPSREGIVNGLKSVGKLRIRTNYDAIITFSALAVILFVAFAIRLFPLRWEIQTGRVHITEFDGYFQYRFTEYLVKNGFISWAWPNHWIDYQRWFPSGIDVANAAYPGLPMTAALLFKIATAVGVNMQLMDFCALLPPFFGMLACLAIYFVGKDFGGKAVGLTAALLLALSPSYIQRSQVGWFDDEINGVVSLLLFIFLFMRSIEEDRPIKSNVKYALGSGLALAYFIGGWGASLYGVGVTMLFVFALIVLRRYNQRLLLSYSISFGLGLMIAINVPRVSPNYLTTVAVLPVAIVFVLLCINEFVRSLTTVKLKVIFVAVFLGILVGGFALFWQMGMARGIAGKFVSVINPFERIATPLIESVAEHRISAWGSIYYEFGIAIVFFIASFYFIFKNLTNRNLFLAIFGLTSLYFASSMVRLLVLMAPAFGLLAAIGLVGIIRPFITLLKEPPKIVTKKKLGLEYVGKEYSGFAVMIIFILLMTNLAFPMPRVYKQAYTPTTITSGSLPIAPNNPVHEWFDTLEWTRNNLQSTTAVVSWWDYGYWLTAMGNVTSLADNATINTTQIENIGFMFMGNETMAIKMMRAYNASYILVFTTFDTNGNWVGFGDDGKWMWMARISGQAHDRFVDKGLMDTKYEWINETSFGYFNNTQNKWIWNPLGRNSTIYEFMSWGKHSWLTANNQGATDPDVYAEPKYFKEAYFAGLGTSLSYVQSNYGSIVPLVCIYQVDWDLYFKDYPNG